MNLTLVNEGDLSIGTPLPWNLYDQHSALLLAQGSVVTDAEHRNKLLTLGACHELFLGTQKNVNDASTPEAGESTTQYGVNGGIKRFSFDDMRLKVEDRLQLQPPVQMVRESFPVKIIGFLRDSTLLITTPTLPNGIHLKFIEGEKIVMRSFSGQHAFGFASTIEKVCKLPYEYLHLSFPDTIEGVVVRKSPRIRTRIVASVKNLGGINIEDKGSTFVSNISADGAALDAVQALGNEGDILNLAFRVSVHNIDVLLSLDGIIHTIMNCRTSETSEPDIVRHGIEFRHTELNDTVLLKSMIYQQIIENPHLQM